LLYVGRLGREKNIGSLKAVLRAMPGVRLALVGDGPARGELEEEFAGMPAVFSGTRRGAELTAAYASADALVFPSTTETLGLAMLEALSSGLPVVAARAGAAHEVVEEGVNGLLYEPEDRDSLVETVRRVLEDGELRAPARGGRQGHGGDQGLGGGHEGASRVLRDGAGGALSKREKIRSGGVRFSKFSLVGLSTPSWTSGCSTSFLAAADRETSLLVLYNGVALVLANVNSYVGNTLWTFRGRAEHNRRQTTLFCLQALLNIGISTGIFWALIHPLPGRTRTYRPTSSATSPRSSPSRSPPSSASSSCATWSSPANAGSRALVRANGPC
jgi:putative flippase GtrA